MRCILNLERKHSYCRSAERVGRLPPGVALSYFTTDSLSHYLSKRSIKTFSCFMGNIFKPVFQLELLFLSGFVYFLSFRYIYRVQLFHEVWSFTKKSPCSKSGVKQLDILDEIGQGTRFFQERFGILNVHMAVGNWFTIDQEERSLNTQLLYLYLTLRQRFF